MRMSHCFFACLALMIAFPFSEGLAMFLVFHALFALVMIRAIFLVNTDRRVRLATVLLAAFWTAVSPLGRADILMGNAVPLQLAADIALFVLAVSVFFVRLLKPHQPNMQTVFTAFILYLSMAFAWAFVYMSMDRLFPGGFLIRTPANATALTVSDAMVYSFSLLSPLKFGDILPMSRTIRALATVEAILGVFYMAVFISKLVAMSQFHEQQD